MARSWDISELAFRSAVALQICYTGLAAFNFFMADTSTNKNAKISSRRIVLILLAAMSLMHAGQIARMIFANHAISDFLIPVLISIFAVGLVVLAINRANLFPKRPQTQAAPQVNLNIGAVLEKLRTDPRFLTPEYRLEDLALSVGVRPEILSKFINHETGRGFVAFINRERNHACVRIDQFSS